MLAKIRGYEAANKQRQAQLINKLKLPALTIPQPGGSIEKPPNQSKLGNSMRTANPQSTKKQSVTAGARNAQRNINQTSSLI